MQLEEKDAYANEAICGASGAAQGSGAASPALTRRGFVSGAAGVAACAALAGAGVGAGVAVQAQASETSSATDVAADRDVPAWLGSAPEIAEDAITETLDCDVLVVGAGTSGLFGACAAAEAGACVLVIEKNEVSPGIRGTIGAIGTTYQLEDDCDIKPSDICREMTMYAASNVNTKLLRLWADESAETVEWYGERCKEAGREFVYCSDHDLDEYADQMNYRHWATGHAAVKDGRTAEDGEVLLDYAQSLGVEVRYQCAMVRLEQDETGRVTGVIAQTQADDDADEGAYLRISAAKGVLVCTGGYALNHDMLEALQPETLLTFSYNSGIAGAVGDGIKACLWAGAAFDEVHTSMLFDRCPLPPDGIAGEPIENGMVWMASQPWLKVNLAGERFCNESAPYDFVLHASLDQPDHTYATIWDANWQQYVTQFKTQGCSRMFPFANGAPVSAIDLEIAAGMNAGMQEAGFIQQADTIEELADKLGIPADALVATVERTNENYASGEDPDFGKEAFRLSPVDAAPFFGVRQTGYMLCTMDGIKIDTDMRALGEDGTPIPGLFVCGNDSGSFFAYTYPDQIPGLAAGRSATFARRAGRIAASGE